MSALAELSLPLDTSNEADFSELKAASASSTANNQNTRPASDEIPDDSVSDRLRLSTTPSPIKRSPTLPFLVQIEGRSNTSKVLAEWNGCVTSIDPSGYSFYASLNGVSGEGVEGEEEEAVIPIDYVSEWDHSLLKPGHFFRLSVIHDISHKTRQPIRYTQVVFRRLPAYHQRDLNKAKERAELLAQQLRVE